MAYIPAIDEFLSELKIQFDRLIDVKEKLDNKANNLMAMSGTISTILMGVGVFIMNTKYNASELFYVMLILFCIGISLLIGSIVVNIFAYRLRTQDYPIGSKNFFCCGKQNNTVVKEYTTAHKIDFQEMIVTMYLDCIQDAEKKIDHKGYLVKRAQILFLIGLLTLPVILLITIVGLQTIPPS